MTQPLGANGATPTLSNPPQFAAEYWQKVPRQSIPVVIHKVRDLPTGEKEFFARTQDGNQMRFRRPAAEVAQLILPGAPASVETVNNELITGLYLPDVKAWAFRMTAEQIAEYAKAVAMSLHQHRQAVRQKMLDHIAEHLLLGLKALALVSDSDDLTPEEIEEQNGLATHLAQVALTALEAGPTE